MLMDIIGVLIAFSVVMLLLSLIVTSLNQATQTTLRLRGRNLRYGVAAALNHETAVPNSENLKEATRLLNATDDASLRKKTADPSTLKGRLLGPRVTWLDPDEMRSVLSDRGGTKLASNTHPSDAGSSSNADKVVERFKKLEKPLRNRFEIMMRAVSLFWAVVIAGVFQISAPELLKQLSSDPTLRAQTIAAAPAVLDTASRQSRTRESYDDIDATAIAKLAANHPDLRSVLHDLDTGVTYPEELSEQLADFIEDSNERGDIVEEFEGYLIAGLEQQRETALSNAREAGDQLSLINITPLQHGWRFYTDKPVRAQNIIGVLVTAILLMLGAPFWYDTLKNAVAWRDLFSMRPPDTPKSTDGNAP